VQLQARHANLGTTFYIYSEIPVHELCENKKLVKGYLSEIIKESNYQVFENEE
jgi:hypothetical protein